MDSPVRFAHVFKEYPFYQHMAAGFKSFLFNIGKNMELLKRGRFVALNDVSFEVARGETFGIIGRNGSGKSTILGLMAGVIRPDRGMVATRGRISSLLELGAGFHPDLSGVENVVLNGILMGHTREEMLRRLDAIVEFSGLGEFVYQPLRTYSSGMHVRLGFSVAVHIDPEILLVDEALAVGDMAFQEKCLARMAAFRDSGATIIMVTHDMASIDRLCDRALWIDAGTVMAIGQPRDVIRQYMASCGQEAVFPDEEDGIVDRIEEHDDVIPGLSLSPVPVDEPAAPSAEYAAAEAPDQSAESAPVSPPRVKSWWDSPLVLADYEAAITGDADTHFFSYLNRRIGGTVRERGLALCCSLEGVEQNFVSNGVVVSMETIDCAAPQAIGADIRQRGSGVFDLVLCIDVLTRMSEPRSLLDDICAGLRTGGILVALEYIGPPRFAWPTDVLALASRLREAIFPQEERGSAPLDAWLADRAVNRTPVLSLIAETFDVADVRKFGGPLYDLVLQRLATEIDYENDRDRVLLNALLTVQQTLIDAGSMEPAYAMVLALRR